MNVKITTDWGEMEFDVPEGKKLELVRSLLWELCTGAQNTPRRYTPYGAQYTPRNWQGLQE